MRKQKKSAAHQRSNSGTLNHQNGFTLLEVMVVVVIIAIMAAAVAPALMGNIEDAQIKRVGQDIKSIETSLNLYSLGPDGRQSEDDIGNWQLDN